MPKKLNVEVGVRFGLLRVVGEGGIHVSSGGYRKRLLRCLCDCGLEITTQLASLRNGVTKSCGCEKARITSQRFRKNVEGVASKDHPLYKTWKGMRERCRNPKNIRFKNYGARGIRVCDEWESFEQFILDVGTRPDRTYTLDRIDFNKGYYKENVRWADHVTQRNSMSSNVRVTFDGVTMNATQWARKFGLNPALVFSRTSRGWTIERALRTPSPGRPTLNPI